MLRSSTLAWLTIILGLAGPAAADIVFRLDVAKTSPSAGTFTVSVNETTAMPDHLGLAAYAFTLEGGIDVFDHASPKASDADGHPVAFNDAFRTPDGRAGSYVAGQPIRGLPGTIVLGFGIRSGTLQASGATTPLSFVEPKPDGAFDANLVLGQGTWSGTMPAISVPDPVSVYTETESGIREALRSATATTGITSVPEPSSSIFMLLPLACCGTRRLTRTWRFV